MHVLPTMILCFVARPVSGELRRNENSRRFLVG